MKLNTSPHHHHCHCLQDSVAVKSLSCSKTAELQFCPQKEDGVATPPLTSHMLRHHNSHCRPLQHSATLYPMWCTKSALLFTKVACNDDIALACRSHMLTRCSKTCICVGLSCNTLHCTETGCSQSVLLLATMLPSWYIAADHDLHVHTANRQQKELQNARVQSSSGCLVRPGQDLQPASETYTAQSQLCQRHLSSRRSGSCATYSHGLALLVTLMISMQ